MSAICAFTRISPATVDRLLESPERVTEFLGLVLPEHYPRTAGNKWVHRFAPRPGTSPETGGHRPQFSPAELTAEHHSLDRAWHALHYLFSQTASSTSPAARFLVTGGTRLDDRTEAREQSAAAWTQLVTSGGTLDELNSRLGPPRLLTAEDVRQWNEFLTSQPWPDLRTGYSPEDMESARIYPRYWFADPLELGPLLYLRKHFEGLRTFVIESAERKSGLLIHYISAIMLER